MFSFWHMLPPHRYTAPEIAVGGISALCYTLSPLNCLASGYRNTMCGPLNRMSHWLSSEYLEGEHQHQQLNDCVVLSSVALCDDPPTHLESHNPHFHRCPPIGSGVKKAGSKQNL